MVADSNDDVWRSTLTPQQYRVLRQGGTEAPFTGEYTDTETAGTYACVACGATLFTSKEKFHSGCGWPAFFAPASSGSVEYLTDTSAGMTRIEVRCAQCHSHLGHAFDGEGFDTPTDRRYCINSICLKLTPDE